MRMWAPLSSEAAKADGHRSAADMWTREKVTEAKRKTRGSFVASLWTTLSLRSEWPSKFHRVLVCALGKLGGDR